MLLTASEIILERNTQLSSNKDLCQGTFSFLMKCLIKYIDQDKRKITK